MPELVYCIQNTECYTQTTRRTHERPTMIARAPLRDEVCRQILDRIHRGDLAARRPRPRHRPRLPARRQPNPDPRGPPPARPGRRAGYHHGPGLPRAPPRSRRAPGGGRHPGRARVAGPPPLASEPSPDRLDRLRQVDRRLEQTRGDVCRCLDLEDEWHRILLEACPNRRLLDLIASLRQVPRRYLAAYMRDAGRLSLSTLPAPEDPAGARGAVDATAPRQCSSSSGDAASPSSKRGSPGLPTPGGPREAARRTSRTWPAGGRTPPAASGAPT